MRVTKVKKKSFLRKATVEKTPVLGGKLFSMVSEENKKPNIQFKSKLFVLKMSKIIYFDRINKLL